MSDKYLNMTGLRIFWQQIKNYIETYVGQHSGAPVSHTHAASDITSGTLNSSYLPVVPVAKGGTGVSTTSANFVFAGDASNNNTAPSFRKLVAADIPNLAASKITSGTLSADRIPSLAASKITSGTFAADRIPSLAASKITSGTFAADRIPNLAASKITSGTLSSDRLPVVPVAKGGTGATTAANARSNLGVTRGNLGGLSLATIFSGINVASNANLGTNTNVFNYRVFMVTTNVSGGYTYLIGYRYGSSSSAGRIYAGSVLVQSATGGDKVLGCDISVSTAGLCKNVYSGYHTIAQGGDMHAYQCNITGLYGLY